MLQVNNVVKENISEHDFKLFGERDNRNTGQVQYIFAFMMINAGSLLWVAKFR